MNPPVCWDPEQGQDCRAGANRPGPQGWEMPLEGHELLSSLPQVPQLYKVKGYHPVSVQGCAASYRPQKLARALRQGAEVTRPAFGEEPPPPFPRCPGPETNVLPLVLAQDEATTVITLPKQECSPQLPGETSVLSIKLPEALAQAPDYDPLYIFVSAISRSHGSPSLCFSSFFIRKQKQIETSLLMVTKGERGVE